MLPPYVSYDVNVFDRLPSRLLSPEEAVMLKEAIMDEPLRPRAVSPPKERRRLVRPDIRLVVDNTVG